MNLRERTASIFVKLIALILGMTAVGFLFIVEHLGGILSVSFFSIYLKFEPSNN